MTIIINKVSWEKNSSQRKDSFLSSYSNTSIPPTQFLKKSHFEVRKSLTPTTRRTLDVKRLSITLPTHTSEIRQKNLKENALFKNWEGEWTWSSLQDKPRASWSVTALCGREQVTEDNKELQHRLGISQQVQSPNPLARTIPAHWAFVKHLRS